MLEQNMRKCLSLGVTCCLCEEIGNLFKVRSVSASGPRSSIEGLNETLVLGADEAGVETDELPGVGIVCVACGDLLKPDNTLFPILLCVMN